MNIEEDFDYNAHRQVVNFRMHCMLPPLALAEAKRFDELYAMEHHPVLAEEEE
ncbi:MAG: hypothetical protein MUC90_04760 [Thermoplasmata archaeon]|nr:hypothetical protein [Thermoplasmata archaeon]